MTRTRHPQASLVACVTLGAALITACGGSSATTATSVTSAGSRGTVATTQVAGYGNVLASASGEALYLLTADPRAGSKCTGSCTARWRPLTVRGRPTAGPGVDAALLSTFKRANGSEQVLYNEHALYTYAGPGVSGGAGIASDGGHWYLVSPSGKAIKTTVNAAY